MGNISLKPLAFESLGARSMSSLIETPDAQILVDPGVSLGMRFGLLPHPEEYRVRTELRNLLREASMKADVVTISHYHHDHYTPNYTENVFIGSSPEEAETLIRDKTLLVKDYRTDVNPSQRRRGWLFHRFAEKHAKNILVADRGEFHFGATRLKFSQPVFHGERGSSLGWVIMLTVTHGDERVTHASDIQGPMDEATLDAILQEKPDLLLVAGPPLYLSDSMVKIELINRGRENLMKLSEKVPTSILDHHLLRSPDWKTFVDPVLRRARSRGNIVQSAANYNGLPERLLECRRRDLYREEPPSSEFMAWTRLPDDRRRLEPPPV